MFDLLLLQGPDASQRDGRGGQGSGVRGRSGRVHGICLRGFVESLVLSWMQLRAADWALRSRAADDLALVMVIVETTKMVLTPEGNLVKAEHGERLVA